MYTKLLRIGSLVVVTTLVLTGCTSVSTGDVDQQTPPTQLVGENGKALQLVTTFPPLFAHTANLVDDNDTLTNLVPPGSSVHTWQPKPSDIVAMEQADAIIINGLGLETFLEDYLENLENQGVRIIDTSEGIEYLEFDKYDLHEDEDEHDDEIDHDDEDEHVDDHDHDHEGPDPHVRLDTKNADIQVRNIANALSALDPTQEKYYNEQAWEYSRSMIDLDTSIRERINPQTIQPFIVFHDAYQYFLQAYDLADKQVGLVQNFHGDSPSQKQIAQLIETITLNNVSIIYTEPQFNPSVVQRLQQETGVEAREIDPIGTELSKDGYKKTMQALAEAFINN